MDIDANEILDAWSVPQPWTIEPAAAGTNNRSLVVTCPAGRLLLQASLNTDDVDRLAAMHAMLGQLHRMPLSFAVPDPVPARNGSTVLRSGQGEGRLVSLYRFIPGSPPDPANLPATRRCGHALRELHEALAQLGLLTSIGNWRELASLEDVHTQEASIRALPIGDTGRAWVLDTFEYVRAILPSLLTGIHTQVVHGDFYPSNVLLHEGRVSGVLDFEFALIGPRVLDVAIGLYAFAVSRRHLSDPAPVMRAFLDGYRSYDDFSPGEYQALAPLLLLRETASLMHWAGRWRQGLTTDGDMVRRARSLIDLENWLRGQPPDLGLP
jgi:homoserine kinase type II